MLQFTDLRMCKQKNKANKSFIRTTIQEPYSEIELETTCLKTNRISMLTGKMAFIRLNYTTKLLCLKYAMRIIRKLLYYISIAKN